MTSGQKGADGESSEGIFLSDLPGAQARRSTRSAEG